MVYCIVGNFMGSNFCGRSVFKISLLTFRGDAAGNSRSYSSTYAFVDDLHLHLLALLCMWAESIWLVVFRYGRKEWPRKTHYLWRLWAVPKDSKPVFHWFRQICCALRIAQISRQGQFSCQQNNATRQQTHKLVTLPLAYAYRVNQSSLYTWACPYDQIHGPARVHQTCSIRCKGRSHSTWYSSTSFQSAGGHRYYKPHDDAWSLGERRDNYITLKHMNKRHWKLTINAPDRLKGARKLYWWT